ncbi:MAG: hypothetical protein MUE40_11925 [Anaerolineae bacterium]|nr:hypothetical protein [Anaerolineae bacterium]
MPGRIVYVLPLIILLAACGSAPADAPAGADSSSAIIQWNRDPYQVVFRAETVGGENGDSPAALNEVPPCTIYGDGRIVYTVPSPAGGVPRVLFDLLDDNQIISFGLYLTIDLQLLAYGEGFSAQVPASTMPVYERLTLAVNGVNHITDAFAEWPTGYYDIILRACQSIPRTPRQFEPDGAWLSVARATYDQNVPTILWDATAADFSFGALAGLEEKRWIEGGIIRILWNALYQNGLNTQFEENGFVYQLALQVPGVTRDAPSAPPAP